MITMIDFMKTMLKLPMHWVIWVGLLMVANMVFPIIFIGTIEGKFVLAAAMISAITQSAIFGSRGFVRLLGIGHIYWVPLVIWLYINHGFSSLDTLFGEWIAALVIVNSLSLIIDAIDVIRYIQGEREPQVS